MSLCCRTSLSFCRHVRANVYQLFGRSADASRTLHFRRHPRLHSMWLCHQHGLHWLKEVRVAGILKVEDVAMASAKFGSMVGRLRCDYKVHPRWNSKRGRLTQIASTRGPPKRLLKRFGQVHSSESSQRCTYPQFIFKPRVFLL